MQPIDTEFHHLSTKVTDAQLRRWLALLDQPHRLGGSTLTRLLESQGRLPTSASPIEVGRAAADLLRDLIAELDPGPHASRKERLPYLVLETCFVRGRKLAQAAAELGLSERQLTRERARAILLLKSALATPRPAPARYPVQSIPGLPDDFVPRPRELIKLAAAFDGARNVRVMGESGVGKTLAVASYLRKKYEPRDVFWHRFRPGVNDSLPAVLFELGEYLRLHGDDELARCFSTPPAADPVFASRIALKGLSRQFHVLAFDDYAASGALDGFISEITDRLDRARVLRVERALNGSSNDASVTIGPFDRQETSALLKRHAVRVDPALVARVHAHNHGRPALIRRTAQMLASSR